MHASSKPKYYHRIHKESSGITKNNPETKDPDKKITKSLSSTPPLMISFPFLETTVTFIFPNAKRPTSQNRLQCQILLRKWIKNLSSSLIKIKLGTREGRKQMRSREQKVVYQTPCGQLKLLKLWIQKISLSLVEGWRATICIREKLWYLISMFTSVQFGSILVHGVATRVGWLDRPSREVGPTVDGPWYPLYLAHFLIDWLPSSRLVKKIPHWGRLVKKFLFISVTKIGISV